jgi:uncharacterized protein
MPLLWVLLLDLPAATCTASGPCAEPPLSAPEVQLARQYQARLTQAPPDTQQALLAQQAAWLSARRACAGEVDADACRVQLLAVNRAALEIAAHRIPVFAAVTYRCPGPDGGALAASYYRSDPPAVQVRYGGEELFAFIARSASGSRYLGPDVELWEHQGVARLSWHGRQLECPKD